jgi:hypothetical protein
MTNGFNKERRGEIHAEGKKVKKVVYRSSKTGEFVTQKYADTHKPTTERQHVTVTKPKKKK